MKPNIENASGALNENSKEDPMHEDVQLMLTDSLAMTPWERILANDDMINFGDSLRDAMEID